MSNAFKTDGTLLTTNDSGTTSTPRRVLVVHTFEDNGTLSAEGMARYQSTPAAGGSYHIVIDNDGVTYRENDDPFMPWSAMPTGNRIGYHFSLSGKAAWSREQWLARPKQLNSLAKILAAYSTAYGIPLILRTADQVRAGKWGVCGHNEISLAFGESDHTDPGREFPYDYVLALAARHQKQPAQAADTSKGTTMTQLSGESRDALHDAKMNAIWANQAAADNQIQLRGPNKRGWDQLGGRTLVDAVARIGVHLGLPGFIDVKTGKTAPVTPTENN
ncbi:MULTISPECIES: peptidoglycan recognition protein family protein [Corynebacterium]|uniref:N-acetylmuramoyl-L-alanine amidase n=1 Tax=Corynebacterium oculi TaxID=1544416 RepID=A0A0Q0YEW0_9CORY|nr:MULTISPECIES: N-acetylmuramoyl-L-alanine amidase [Corynebacterium]KQB84944.1 N-acetylmuramoyl-L-alanine amidase [Corynebacterium oculi]MDK8450897.1 N-acetylmuramoyl-L-alanine amidase [Corynebacterium mastitidis]